MNKIFFRLVFGFILLSSPLHAMALVGLIPFGGTIDMIVPCTCAMEAGIEQSLVIVNTVTPPYINSYLYTFGEAPLGTTLYSNFMAIVPSVYLLGLSLPVLEVCWVGAAPYCTSGGMGFPIVMEGTSL